MKKILIICSKQFYSYIPRIEETLRQKGYEVHLPNCYDNPEMEDKMKSLSVDEHKKFKAAMFQQSEMTIKAMDAVLVLNLDKNKDGVIYSNYIGGATFLEMYDAFRLKKEIYLYHDIPDGILKDEIVGFNPVVIQENLDYIK